MTTEDEILALLKEIRNIQQEHLEAYRAQSQRGISMTATAMRRQRIALVFIFAMLGAMAWYTVSQTQTFEWKAITSEWKAIQDRAQQQLEEADRQRHQHQHQDAPTENAK